VRASLPEPEFTLAWNHSVQKTRWEERYRVDGSGLMLIEARVLGSGAGMEPAPDAVLRNGAWTWRPRTPVRELRLTRSGFVPDYTLCWRDRCTELGRLVGNTADGAVVVVRPCVT
jgi:hypothetical protein